jgi:hypothetical protein
MATKIRTIYLQPDLKSGASKIYPNNKKQKNNGKDLKPKVV